MPKTIKPHASRLDWSFLLALNLGERYELDLTPSPTEKLHNTPPSKRALYTRCMQWIWSQRNSNMQFVLRLGDFRKKKEFNKAYVYCIEKDGQTISAPPLSGFKSAVLAHEHKKAAIAALPAQLEAARAEQSTRRTEHTAPPHMRQVTKDDTMRLVRLVEAHTTGTSIQELRGTSWVDTKTPNWTLPVAQLRIKPKPLREVWVLFERGHIGNFTRVSSMYDTETDIPKTVDHECIVHYREVSFEEESE